MLGIQRERPSPTTIESAWNDLTPQAFALWMRLMTLQNWDLQQGRKRIIELVGKHRCWVNRYLKELHEKGYIRLEAKPGLPTKLVVTLAPMIITPNHFVNFG